MTEDARGEAPEETMGETMGETVEEAPGQVTGLATALAEQEEGLLTCVHCGFCLPACPTYLRLGDENDSPRGRLHLMRAVVEGRLDPASDAFRTHIDRCLGCRACEPVCPSGVPYGELLELARAEGRRARAATGGAGGGVVAATLLWTFASGRRTSLFLALGRVARALGVAALLGRLLPRRGWLGRLRLAFAMLAATRPVALESVGRGTPESIRPGGVGRGAPEEAAGTEDGGSDGSRGERSGERSAVSLLEGCVQSGLFGHVNRATREVLAANGFDEVGAPGQGCCGALHAHAGDLATARRMARRNVDAFEASGAGSVVVNSAGCGAAMKAYGHLLAGDPDYAEHAASLSERVRDVAEVLAAVGPLEGAPLRIRVAYDPPCHLVHAQGVDAESVRVLGAVPGLEVVRAEEADECCGGAGIYGLTHPELGREIGRDKVERLRATGADVVATGNPGCIIQIGGVARQAGTGRLSVVHPVELLAESYRRVGRIGKTPEEGGGR